MSRISREVTALIGGLMLLLGGAACSSADGNLQSVCSLPSAQWCAGDTLTYQFLIADPRTAYRVTLLTRHNHRYPYTTLDLQMILSTPSGYRRQQALHLPLADRPGHWQGSGVGLIQTAFAADAPVRFPHSDLCRIQLALPAPTDTLVGIESIAVQLTPVP